MIRVMSLVVFILILIFGTLLYVKYGKHYTNEGFVAAPSSSMGVVPVITNSSSVPNTMPGSTVTDPNKPTLSDLKNALTRVEFEKRSLENTRSTSDNIKSRIAILDKVKADLSEYISKIKRKKMNINDIHFTKSDLGAFLIKKTDALSTKANTKKKPTNNVAKPLDGAMKDVKWGVTINYDPKINFLRTISEKMERIDKEINSNKLTPEQMSSKILELKILEQQVAAVNKRNITKANRNLNAYSNNSVENPETVPTSNTRKPFFLDQKPPSSTNELPYRRGPTEMIDIIEQSENEQGFHDYTKRATKASFDNDSVIGQDYKKKAAFLCSQIQNADLGDPADFGCIKNPETDVSPDYSWRGNYKMVCSRLGRIWGGWYPEMFGCPETVGTDKQAPVIFESNK
jgi:hypothetical protein